MTDMMRNITADGNNTMHLSNILIVKMKGALEWMK